MSTEPAQDTQTEPESESESAVDSESGSDSDSDSEPTPSANDILPHIRPLATITDHTTWVVSKGNHASRTAYHKNHNGTPACGTERNKATSTFDTWAKEKAEAWRSQCKICFAAERASTDSPSNPESGSGSGSGSDTGGDSV